MAEQRQVVFWDFDGTLAQREGTWPAILRDAILAADPTHTVTVEGLAAGLEQGFPHWGPDGMRAHPDAAAWWTAASPPLLNASLNAGVESSVSYAAVSEVPRIYYQPTSWRLMPGAMRALKQTSRAGFTNVILSNHAPELPELVHALGFAPLVERTITSASLGIEKPDPRIFLAALRIAGGAPDSWMIGDNPTTDIEGAKAAGMRAVLVHRSTTGSPPLTLTDAAGQVIRDFSAAR